MLRCTPANGTLAETPLVPVMVSRQVPPEKTLPAGQESAEGTGVATGEEIGVETFEQRLRDEWKRTRAVAGTSILLSAWATTGPE